MDTDNKKTVTVPFYAFESMLAALERERMRLYILCAVLITAFVSTNVLWMLHIGKLGR